MPITNKTSLQTIIDDFVNSSDKRFEGKSKDERVKMAKGAFYGMQKESIQGFIRALGTGDKSTAFDLFNQVISQKVASRLEDMKVDVANQYFNGANESVDENTYSAKAGAEGEDLGKPGKNFAKIASKAGKEYGSAEAGKKVAGAILAKLRAKK